MPTPIGWKQPRSDSNAADSFIRETSVFLKKDRSFFQKGKFTSNLGGNLEGAIEKIATFSKEKFIKTPKAAENLKVFASHLKEKVNPKKGKLISILGFFSFFFKKRKDYLDKERKQRESQFNKLSNSIEQLEKIIKKKEKEKEMMIKTAINSLIPENYEAPTLKYEEDKAYVHIQNKEIDTSSLKAFQTQLSTITKEIHNKEGVGADQFFPILLAMVAKLVVENKLKNFLKNIKLQHPDFIDKSREDSYIRTMILAAATHLKLNTDATGWLLSIEKDYPADLIKKASEKVGDS